MLKLPCNEESLKEIREFIINSKDKDGCTLLHLAVQKSDKGLVKYLIDHGADVNAKDDDEIIDIFQKMER